MPESVELISRSQRGRVLLVRDAETGERYIRKELEGEYPVYTRLRELEHPYLPRIGEVELRDGRTVIREEYIDGVTLDKAGLDQGQLTRLLLELCDVLDFLHSRGILHRDIKPSNLMLAPDGHLRLIDFDAAREEKGEQERDTRLLGTRGYAPPEQYGFSQTDQRADIYALGVTFGQLLGPLSRRRRWKGILRKCTALDPKDRYTSAAQVKRAVYRGRVWRWLARPALTAVVGCAAVQLCVLAGVYLYSPDFREVVDTVGLTDRHYIFAGVDIDAMKKACPDGPKGSRYGGDTAAQAGALRAAYPGSAPVFSGYWTVEGEAVFGMLEWSYYEGAGTYDYGRFQGLCMVDQEGGTRWVTVEQCNAQPSLYAPAVLAVYENEVFDTHIF